MLEAVYHIDPPKAAYDGSEIQIQTVFRSRANIMCPRVLIVAVPNAAKRTQWAINQARREGISPGFPDLICIWPGKTAYIELKTRTGQISANQKEWMERLTSYGFPAGVFRHPDTALKFLRANGAPFITREGL